MLHSLLHCSNTRARDSAPGGPACTGATRCSNARRGRCPLPVGVCRPCVEVSSRDLTVPVRRGILDLSRRKLTGRSPRWPRSTFSSTAGGARCRWSGCARARQRGTAPGGARAQLRLRPAPGPQAAARGVRRAAGGGRRVLMAEMLKKVPYVCRSPDGRLVRAVETGREFRVREATDRLAGGGGFAPGPATTSRASSCTTGRARTARWRRSYCEGEE